MVLQPQHCLQYSNLCSTFIGKENLDVENEDFFPLFHHQVHTPLLMGCAHGGEPNAKENAPLWAPSYHTSDGRLQNKNHPWKLETKARVVSTVVWLRRLLRPQPHQCDPFATKSLIPQRILIMSIPSVWFARKPLTTVVWLRKLYCLLKPTEDCLYALASASTLDCLCALASASTLNCLYELASASTLDCLYALASASTLDCLCARERVIQDC